jgi:hypothetical protein
MKRDNRVSLLFGNEEVSLKSNYDLSATLDFIKLSGKKFPDIAIHHNKKRSVR